MSRSTKIHLGGEPRQTVRGLEVRNGCDLRASLEEKCAAAQKSWELFVNKRGTLAHLVHPHQEVLVRVAARGGESFQLPAYARSIVGERVRKALEELPPSMKGDPHIWYGPHREDVR